MTTDDTQKILQIEKEIQQYLGQDSDHIVNFKYELRDGKMHVYVETINPKYNQMFLYNSETGVDKLDALQKMLDYVKHNKDKEDSYTIQWSDTGERGVRTSYFSGATLEEALAKFRYGRDRNKTTIFLISLNSKA
jgi:predicted ATP-grasp superfamily ATP-dependent carboligase